MAHGHSHGEAEHGHSHGEAEHGHSHSRHKPRDNTWRYAVVISLTTSFFFVELVVGHICESLALVADSFHMLSDIVGLAVALFSYRISRLPASKRNTFGWQRAEVVGTAVNTVILLTLAFTICIEAIQRFVKVECVRDPRLMFSVGVAGLGINVLALIILSGHGHGHSHGGGGEGKSKKKSKGEPTPTPKVLEADNNHHEYECLVDPPSNQQAVGNALAVTTPTKTGSNHHINASSPSPRDQVTVELTPINGSNTTDEEDEDAVADVVAEEAATEEAVKVVLNPQRRLESGSMGMKAAFLHVMADALGSVIVVIVSVTLWITTGGERKATEEECEAKTPKLLLYIDPALSCVLVALIFVTTSPLARKSILVLLQSVPRNINIAELKERLENLDGVLRVHDLHVWRLQGSAIIASVHVRFETLNDYFRVSKEMKRIFHEAGIHCTTIQPEISEHLSLTQSPDNVCLLTCGDDQQPGAECGMQSVCCPNTSSTETSSANRPAADTNSASKSPPAASNSTENSKKKHS